MGNKSSRTFPGSEPPAALVCCGWAGPLHFTDQGRHVLLLYFLVKLPNLRPGESK